MIRIGLLADTHIRELTQGLPQPLIEAFRGVDLILHAGDIYVPEVLDRLEVIAPVLAAIGDDDYGAVLTDRRVKETHELVYEGKTVLLLHESLQYQRIKSPRDHYLPEPAELPDILVFGHTHYPILEQHNGTLFVNPGSPIDYQGTLGTVALLTIDSRMPPEAHTIKLKK